MIGQRFGKLIVLRKDTDRSAKRYRWRCRCDCGKEKAIYGYSLRDGSTKSCGCNKFRLEQGLAAKRKLFGRYKRVAAKRRLTFDLTFEKFVKICQEPCVYCGDPPSQNVGGRYEIGKFNGEFIHNGIDRIDNSQGYTEQNCVSCCQVCNFMKNTLSKDAFVSQVRKIHEVTKEWNIIVTIREVPFTKKALDLTAAQNVLECAKDGIGK